MIELKNVSKKYFIKNKCSFKLDEINFKIDSNSLTFILGKSGCGKTTLLNILGALDTADEGSILVNSIDISKFGEKELCNYRNNCIGFIFQDFNLIPDLSVAENIELSIAAQNSKITMEEVDQLLYKVGLPNFSSRKINELSGGQKQRVALARALIKQPKILLCDEPTGALDSETSKEIFELLKEIAKECHVIVVTHDAESANKYGDAIIELSDGKVISEKHFKDGFNNKFESINKPNKLTTKYKFKLGFSNLKKRPIRLVLSILMLVVSTCAMAFSFSMTQIDSEKTILNKMADMKVNYLILDKIYPNGEMFNFRNYTETDINNLKEAFNVDYIPSLYENFRYLKDNFITTSNIGDVRISGFMESDNNLLEKMQLQLSKGKLPETDDEIALSLYEYEKFYRNGYKRFDDEIKQPTMDDLIGKIVYLSSENENNGKDFTIVGFVDTNYFDYSKNFSDLDFAQTIESTTLNSELHETVFLNSGYYERNLQHRFDELINNVSGLSFHFNFMNTETYYFDYVAKENTGFDIYKFNNETSKHCIYLPFSKYIKSLDDSIDGVARTFAQQVYNEQREGINTSWDYYEYYEYLEENNFEDTQYLNVDRKFFINLVVQKVYKSKQESYWSNIILNTGKNDNEIDIGGLFDDSESTNNFVIADDYIYGQYLSSIEYYLHEHSRVVLPLSNNLKKNKELLMKARNFKNFEKGDFYKIEFTNEFFKAYDRVSSSFESFKKLFTYGSLVLLAISVLISFFYFSGAVFDKTKDVGIYKSLGIRKRDIILTFIIQTATIDLIAFGLSLLLSLFAISGGNIVLANSASIPMIFLFANIPSLLLSLVFITICTLIGLFVPLIKCLRKSPIEVLREL